MTHLNIPYRSQWDKADAGNYDADCGPTCAAMILNYHNISSTPNSIYAENFPHKKKSEFTNFTELMAVFKKHGVAIEYRQANNRQEALYHLRANIDAGKPMVTLINYLHWRQHDPIGRNKFNGGHFVVVVGYDNAHVYIHDPLFGLWVSVNHGAYYPLPIDIFCAGWAGFAQGNPNWAYLLAAANGSQPTAVTQPAPPVPTPPKPAPVAPAPVSDSASSKTMDDINRRIRTLAAYRWAEEPNFNDATAVALWREHLGDWGLTYREHIVQSGDSYSALAQRYYSEARRWPGIRAYNTFTHDGLWVGETVLIPNVGESGAHLSPALPKNTVDFAKAIDLDNLVDPDEVPLDYDALWDDSINLGHVEAEN